MDSSGPTGVRSAVELRRRLARNNPSFRHGWLRPPKHNRALVELSGRFGALPHGGGNDAGADTLLTDDMDILGRQTMPCRQLVLLALARLCFLQ